MVGRAVLRRLETLPGPVQPGLAGRCKLFAAFPEAERLFQRSVSGLQLANHIDQLVAGLFVRKGGLGRDVVGAVNVVGGLAHGSTLAVAWSADPLIIGVQPCERRYIVVPPGPCDLRSRQASEDYFVPATSEGIDRATRRRSGRLAGTPGGDDRITGASGVSGLDVCYLSEACKPL